MFVESSQNFEVLKEINFSLFGMGPRYRKRAERMKPDDRVNLLNNTFKFIKDHYPDMTRFLRLAYDDGRPAFDMAFGSEI